MNVPEPVPPITPDDPGGPVPAPAVPPDPLHPPGRPISEPDGPRPRKLGPAAARSLRSA